MATYSAILDAEVSAEAPITVSLMTRLRDNALSYLGAPTGTLAVFHQNSGPLGWTKVTTHNDKALRVVNGNIVNGGTMGFLACFAVSRSTAQITLVQGNLPSLNLTGSVATGVTVGAGAYTFNNNEQVQGYSGSGTLKAVPGWDFRNTATAALDSGSVTVPLGGASNPITGITNMQVQYMDVIVAQKD